MFIFNIDMWMNVSNYFQVNIKKNNSSKQTWMTSGPVELSRKVNFSFESLLVYSIHNNNDKKKHWCIWKYCYRQGIILFQKIFLKCSFSFWKYQARNPTRYRFLKTSPTPTRPERPVVLPDPMDTLTPTWTLRRDIRKVVSVKIHRALEGHPRAMLEVNWGSVNWPHMTWIIELNSLVALLVLTYNKSNFQIWPFFSFCRPQKQFIFVLLLYIVSLLLCVWTRVFVNQSFSLFVLKVFD